MKITFIDGSPKTKNSTSYYLLACLESKLSNMAVVAWHSARKPSLQQLLFDIQESQAVVFSFPLYVDALPSHLLSLMVQLESLLADAPCQAKIYAICNSGFYEAQQSSIALAMLQLWAQKCNLTWGQGLAVGGGPMASVAPLGKGPASSLGKNVDAFASSLSCLQAKDTLFVQPNFPRALYKMMAHMGWRLSAKQNGLKSRELYHQPHADN